MYEALVMLKPGNTFSVDEMEALVKKVTAATVRRESDSVIVETESAGFDIDYNDEPYVVEESIEITGDSGIDCYASTVRFEVQGEDPEMELFNDYLLVMETLDKMDKFVIYDPTEGIEFSDWGK